MAVILLLTFRLCLSLFLFLYLPGHWTVIIFAKVANHIYQPLRSGRIWHKVNF